ANPSTPISAFRCPAPAKRRPPPCSSTARRRRRCADRTSLPISRRWFPNISKTASAWGSRPAPPSSAMGRPERFAFRRLHPALWTGRGIGQAVCRVVAAGVFLALVPIVAAGSGAARADPPKPARERLTDRVCDLIEFHSDRAGLPRDFLARLIG